MKAKWIVFGKKKLHFSKEIYIFAVFYSGITY